MLSVIPCLLGVGKNVEKANKKKTKTSKSTVDCFAPLLFRCILASLYEAVSVGWLVGQSHANLKIA